MTGNHDTTQPLETSLAVIPRSVLIRWHEFAIVAADPKCGAEYQRVYAEMLKNGIEWALQLADRQGPETREEVR